MKLKLLLICVLAIFGLTACNNQNAKVTAENNKTEPIKEIESKKDKTPVLVELFTSEG